MDDEVNALPAYRLHDPALLRTLMQRTGDGSSVSIRDLGAAAGIAHSVIGKLLNGDQEVTNHNAAAAVADRIGVDLLVIWTPAERSDAAVRRLAGAGVR